MLLFEQEMFPSGSCGHRAGGTVGKVVESLGERAERNGLWDLMLGLASASLPVYSLVLTC